jgi:hypothetical protein
MKAERKVLRGQARDRIGLAGVGQGYQRQRPLLATEFGTHDINTVADEAQAVLHAGDNDGLDAGEGGGGPVGAMRAAVAAKSSSQWRNSRRQMRKHWG